MTHSLPALIFTSIFLSSSVAWPCDPPSPEECPYFEGPAPGFIEVGALYAAAERAVLVVVESEVADDQGRGESKLRVLDELKGSGPKELSLPFVLPRATCPGNGLGVGTRIVLFWPMSDRCRPFFLGVPEKDGIFHLGKEKLSRAQLLKRLQNRKFRLPNP